MTREEAIAIFRGFKFLPREMEAVDMAIRALEQQPSEDVISRQVVKEQMIKYGFNAPDMTVTEFVESLPPVTPQQKVGKWIYTGDYITDGMLKCSECGFEHDVSERFVYCPNCGKRMEIEE